MTDDQIKQHLRTIYGGLRSLHESVNLVAVRAIELAELVDASSAQYPEGFANRLADLVFGRSAQADVRAGAARGRWVNARS